jgi:hypothetical protein
VYIFQNIKGIKGGPDEVVPEAAAGEVSDVATQSTSL